MTTLIGCVAKVLKGHTTPASAYVREDTFYSADQRCTARHWLDYSKHHGFRLASQTTNPYTHGLEWNPIRYSEYAPLGIMFLDGHGAVRWMVVTEDTVDALAEFEADYADALTSPMHQKALRRLRVARESRERRQAQFNTAQTLPPYPGGDFAYATAA